MKSQNQTGSGGKARPGRRIWWNAAFAAVILLAALGLFLLRSREPGLYARVDFGMGVVEQLPLAEDKDYFYEVGGYVVHLQVKDGAIAFLDSQCPDGVCEQFGWLQEEDQWACCMPAGVFVTIEAWEG